MDEINRKIRDNVCSLDVDEKKMDYGDDDDDDDDDDDFSINDMCLMKQKSATLQRAGIPSFEETCAPKAFVYQNKIIGFNIPPKEFEKQQEQSSRNEHFDLHFICQRDFGEFLGMTECLHFRLASQSEDNNERLHNLREFVELIQRNVTEAATAGAADIVTSTDRDRQKTVGGFDIFRYVMIANHYGIIPYRYAPFFTTIYGTPSSDNAKIEFVTKRLTDAVVDRDS